MRLNAREQILLRASDGVPTEHVVVSNSGWYLFNAWPLACGNARADARLAWRFFSNDVDLDLLHDRLTRTAARAGCRVEELNVFKDEQVFLSIPGTSFPVPIPYVVTYREMQLSCVFTKPVAAEARK